MKANQPFASQSNSILTLRTLYLFVMALPWLWLLLLGIFVFVVTLQQGAWPSYGHPDPKYAGTISFLYIPTIFLMVAVISSAPTGLLLTLLSMWKRFPLRLTGKEVAIYLLGLALFSLITFADMAELMTWLGD